MNNCIKQVLDLNEIHKALMYKETRASRCDSTDFRISISRSTLNFIKADLTETLVFQRATDITMEASKIEDGRTTLFGVRTVVDDSLKFGEFEILRRM